MRLEQIRDVDRRLHCAVVDQLRCDPGVRSPDIHIGVCEGVVIVTGFAGSAREKGVVGRAVRSVQGVRGIVNHIQVKRRHGPADPEIARAVVRAFALTCSVPHESLTVTIHAGNVVLEGAVDWTFQSEAAETTARNIQGVQRVRNRIAVRPQALTDEVRLKIEAALRRSAEANARQISVTSEEGTVHLRGNARSRAEKEEVHRAAWSAVGVANVVDELAVIP